MSQYNIGAKAFKAGEDLEAFRRVKLSAGTGDTVVYSDAGEDFIGITAAKVVSGDFVSVDFKTRGRTFKAVAVGILGVGDSFYGAADGKVGPTVSGSIIGKTLEASAADLEVIEVLLA